MTAAQNSSVQPLVCFGVRAGTGGRLRGGGRVQGDVWIIGELTRPHALLRVVRLISSGETGPQEPLPRAGERGHGCSLVSRSWGWSCRSLGLEPAGLSDRQGVRATEGLELSFCLQRLFRRKFGDVLLWECVD